MPPNRTNRISARKVIGVMTDDELMDEVLERVIALYQQVREFRQEMRQGSDGMRGSPESRTETQENRAGGATIEITIRIKVEENI